jgi:hypothetical protein
MELADGIAALDLSAVQQAHVLARGAETDPNDASPVGAELPNPEAISQNQIYCADHATQPASRWLRRHGRFCRGRADPLVQSAIDECQWDRSWDPKSVLVARFMLR